jgi:hypothetical protein
MSKALLKSICNRTVLSGLIDLFSLNPSVTLALKSFSAVTVEWSFLKPCWKTGMSRVSVNVGRIKHSRIFIAGHSSDTGLKELESLGDLLCLSYGMIV